MKQDKNRKAVGQEQFKNFKRKQGRMLKKWYRKNYQK